MSAGKCLGYHHFLPFAVRERLNHPVPQRFYPHGINGIADDPAVTGPQPAEETGIRRTPKTNHLFNCQILYIGLLRQDDAHLACQLPPRECSDIPAVQQQAAVQLRKESRERLQKG